MRLDKAVAAGASVSTKVAQKHVKAGRVRLNDLVCTDVKFQAVPGIDVITLTEAMATTVVPCEAEFFLLHKTKDTVCQHHPSEPTVFDLIPEVHRNLGLEPVGRLDKDTTGLLLLCNDGGLRHLLTFPGSKVYKVYICTLGEGQSLPADAAERFQSGLVLSEDGTRCAPARLEIVSCRKVRVTIHEGFFHQVKRMIAELGASVVDLHREQYGVIADPHLEPGQMRSLRLDELRSIAALLPEDRTGKREVPWEKRKAESPGWYSS
eukprot:FR742381.1.p1 GENE.FR742381.1~~FR742381.1.p1  ORF type:complete len:264 (+),score=14.59 FR742381.1:84-875(+)